MARRSISVDELPPHLRAAARTQIAIGPNSPLRGAAARSPRVDREHPMQAAIVEWIDDPSTLPQYPELKSSYSIPNESHGKRDGAMKKLRGRRAGMPDLVLPTPRRDGPVVYGALYLEIKDESSGVVRKNQRERIATLRAAGNRCDVAMSADAAKAIIIQYLNLPTP